ncbi:SDR family oxidoreductase [Actinacidiphila bryophytorum]|uniref:NAD(P)-dependent dehydrogenase, short-chain alcohol dehydrogenase family n=1 Tax=Actinacidiphila bryophytorum TaxID=1436133 RepID=A0A9W4H2N0_9ACTN|nr:SDR family oxidoreductase [Actinacidiphila bryophytorum]MBM9440294.1 SDR family oxidoreductase [Actinacidiphila bryophytorum]MBN6545995.1 SDR family oxidoreductase [Actinacidiphila bryophytorum]CAG7645716.1 NAD(P)-dependent dehydrogenase, short-chain alcohol dehydrogenase family [Actinacidiphila bryophytorum]
MSEKLTDKRILVVGGGRGIGAEIVRRTRQAGADVVVAARSGPGVRIDVTDETTVARAAESLGAFDHVISTASAHHDVPVPELEHDKIQAAFSAKVVGPLLLAKHFFPRMPAHGSFLFFSGIVGWRPKPGTVVKGTSNAALAALVTHLAVELAPVRVNAVAPGVTDSGTWDRLPDERRRALYDSAAAASLAGRVGTLDDVADTALWLLGAGWVTGETVHVDGGARHR